MTSFAAARCLMEKNVRSLYMVFNGFDLGVKDKNGRSICVGDKVIYIWEGCESIGRVIYSPLHFCFGIEYEDDFDDFCSVSPDYFKYVEVLDE